MLNNITFNQVHEARFHSTFLKQGTSFNIFYLFGLAQGIYSFLCNFTIYWILFNQIKFISDYIDDGRSLGHLWKVM